MRRTKGVRLGRRLVRVFRRLKPPSSVAGALSKLGSLLKQGAIYLRLKRGDSGYIRVGNDPVEQKKVSVPKGHLAVYVGEREDLARRRVTVPVIYFNHPLFANLLREAEAVFGFDHAGGIQIPCRISEFENVQVAIKNRRRRRRGARSTSDT